MAETYNKKSRSVEGDHWSIRLGLDPIDRTIDHSLSPEAITAWIERHEETVQVLGNEPEVKTIHTQLDVVQSEGTITEQVKTTIFTESKRISMGTTSVDVRRGHVANERK